MRLISVFVVLLVAACGPKVEPPVGAAQIGVSEMETLGAAVAREINLMRNDPFAYSVRVKAMKSYFKHSPSCEPPADPCRLVLPGEVVIGGFNYRSFDAAIDEAVEALRAAPALPQFAPSRALKQAAATHVADRGALAGNTPHKGSDGANLRERINRNGIARGKIAEAIMYGQQTAFGVVSAWLVDRGTPNTLHRNMLLDPQLGAIGVACGPSDKHRLACVANFADSVSQ